MLLLSDFEEHEEGEGMIQSTWFCPLCGSPIVAYPCGNPIFRTTYAIMCSNEDCKPMPSSYGPVKAVLQLSADDLFAQGLTEGETVDGLALEYSREVQERYGKKEEESE